MSFKNVTVAGSGVLGYQIAFQTAFKGFNVVVYDINDVVLNKAKEKFNVLAAAYKNDLNASEQQILETKARMSYSSDLNKALDEADLLIEAIPENPKIKIEFYQNAAKVAPSKTIFTTNSSTLLPSQFAEYTGRPEKFLALHFANEIWIHNTAEIMSQPKTEVKVFNQVVEFAKQIGMIALPLHKEQPGYILNTLLVPLLDAATYLLVNDIADYQTIDKTWMTATGSPIGPCGILDLVGITTAYNINLMALTKNPEKQKVVDYLKTNFIDTNKLGVNTGEGFYKYPNPIYKSKEFLK